MASIATNYLPFFFSSLILFLSISTNCKSLTMPCASFDCGKGIAIGYPFWQHNHQPEFCGYPNLAISCTNNQPILHLTNNSYRIQNFNSSEKTITISYTDTTTCPIVPNNFKFESTSSLDYNNDNKMVKFYYNCTVYPPSVPDIKCLQRGAKHSYAFLDESVPEFDWIHNCESTVTAPVIEKAVDDPVGNGYGDAIKEGFKLTWKPVDNACGLCEVNGGFCGYSSDGADQKFICFCNDGIHHSKNCQPQSKMSLKSHPNYVVIGGMIFGGFLVICIGIYFIINNKIHMQKRGFNKILYIIGK